MITERDLREAIAECEGVRNPSTSTCIKLAAFYTILNQISGEQVEAERPRAGYSMLAKPEVKYSGSDFSKVVKSKGLEACFPILDEIMGALLVCNPRLYNSAMNRLQDV